MSFIVEITLFNNPLLFNETFEQVPDAKCQFEDIHYVTDSDGQTHYVLFWWTSGCEFSTFESAMERDKTVVEYRPITDIAGRRLYRIVTIPFPEDQPLVFPLFREFDITTLESSRDIDGLHLRARFPTREALYQFIEAGRQIAREHRITRIYAEDTSSRELNELTQRQREALTTAFHRGYFDTPRTVTLEELANEFDITPQTLSRHIRIGVRKAVENLVV